MVKALDKKLMRDLWRMRAQVVTIALVVACGIASYVAMHTALRSLVFSRDVHYADAQLADVFAHANRVPEAVLRQVRALEGVAMAEGRARELLRVEVPGVSEPARGVFVSLPEGGTLNQLRFRRGGPPVSDHDVVVNDAFANAHFLSPGSTLAVVINAKRSIVSVSGIAVSPEFLWVIPEGAFWNDDSRFGVFWMKHAALASALGMSGTFNDLAIRLNRGASEAHVIAAVDRLLEPWGSYGAYGRDRQMSHRLVDQELRQLKGSAAILPTAFLGVAAFLLNLLLGRVVGAQREQLAALKALGYTNRRIAWHYIELALAIVGLGSLLGAAGGAWAGASFVQLYSRYFRFPVLSYRFDLSVVLTAVVITVVAALIGALLAVRRAVTIAPAEAMRPEAPAIYKRSLAERMGIDKLVSPAGRMILRSLERKPLRLLLSGVAIAFATAVLVAGNAMFDSVDLLFQRQFELVQREDLAVSFADDVPQRAVHDLARLPGVLYAEGQRGAAVRIRRGHLMRELTLNVGSEKLRLRQFLDAKGELLALPQRGIALSRALGELLLVGVGDFVDVELLEGGRRRQRMEVTALVDDFLGLSAYTTEAAFAALSREAPRVSQAFLSIDRATMGEVLARLVALPRVAAVARREVASEQFRKQFADAFTTYQALLAIFAAIIAVAVVYNNARIAFVTRSRDLATLRILGFTRTEAGRLLLAEQAAQLAVGIPLGLPLGKALAGLAFSTVDPELFRLPVTISARTFALAGLVIFAAGSASAAFVRRNADKLDLVAVLKARD